MAEALPSSLRLRPGGHERWRSRAFGVDLDLGFPAPGLPRTTEDWDAEAQTRVELVYASSIGDGWPAGGRQVGLMGPPERPLMVVDEHPEVGYRIRPLPYGTYLISADASFVACAPPAVSWWYWQRLLIGQVLPALAVLRGAEVLHASAVTVDDEVIAFAGEPGVGKSSLALQSLLAGASLVAEDVLTLTPDGDGLLAHPGAAMLNVSASEYARVPAEALAALGRRVGESFGKVHLITDREHRSLPLRALYMLERGDGTAPTFERVEAPGMRDVVGQTFVAYVWRPDRLITQLDVASRLARTVPIVKLRVQPGSDAAALAAEVAEHARGLSRESRPA